MKHERQDDSEVPEYVPTRRELKRLAVFWAVEYIANRWWWFAYQQTGSAERSERHEALSHLNRMGEILGSETMEIVWRDAEALVRKNSPKLTDEDWRVFTKGTEDEQQAWREKILQIEDEERVVTAEEARELHALFGARQANDYEPRQTT
jgi:hypothetical protein